jgi:uncharacterized RDD family membrane protein YckC
LTTPEDPNQPPPSYGQPPPSGLPQFGSPQYGAPPPGASQWAVTQFGAPPPSGPYSGGAPYASWGQRVGAWFLDALITGLPGLVLVFIGIAIGHGVGILIGIIGYLAIVIFGIWNVVFRQGTTGQTLGKSQLGIKLIREIDGQVLGPGMCFVRQLVHAVDGFACDIGYLWPLWDAKRQTFADKICSTIVIKV